MPTSRPDPLPRFRKPPLVEVVLAVAFDRLEGLSAPQLGQFWRESFPGLERVEEHPPYLPPTEVFGAPSAGYQVRFQVMGQPPSPRLWFLNTSGTELVQVQRDWFARNWRKQGPDDEYLHYESVREPFEQNLSDLADFVERHNLGQLVPRQCEVTYVNQITPEGVWGDFGDAHRVLKLMADPSNEAFLSRPEDVAVQLRFEMDAMERGPIGRLHVTFQPAYRQPDAAPIFIMNLTARGAPLQAGLGGVYGFLDLGHEWVVRGFADLTTDDMHRAWERYV